MPLGAFTRRHFTTLVGAGTLCSRGAWGAVAHFGIASRLTPLADQIYIPPVNLSTVADLYRRMTAPININGSGPFGFVVDTGANQSVVSEELAAQLGLVQGPFEPLNGVAGVENAATTKATLEIGGRVEKDVVFSILPAKAIGG